VNRAVIIAAFAFLFLLAVLLHTPIKDWLWAHPWWHSFIVLLPTIALAVFAFLDLRHSVEANGLRVEANSLRREANALHENENILQRKIADLEEERNHHLQKIADNTTKPITLAEQNANILRKYLRARARVSEGQGGWGDAAEIVEVSDNNIVTLFTPRGGLTTAASCVGVRCDELEITEIPEGSCPLRIKVLKRYGPDVQLGEITKWEDRSQSPAILTGAKGPNVVHATYSKQGTGETRSLNVYVASDGSNSFVLEASSGGPHTGNNIEISKRFMLLQIEYLAAGFTHSGSGIGGSPHPLFIKTT
jgi:hypothetical protein